MSELEQRLRDLAGEIDWPGTPPFVLALGEPRDRRSRRWLLAVAAVAVAAAVALSVPAARSAILRIFHLGGVTVQRVSSLPAAQRRPLTAELGREVDAATARHVLGGAMRLPRGRGHGPLYLRQGVVSVVLHGHRPLLLSELRGPSYVIKKVAATSAVVGVSVGGAPGIWLTGGEHVVLFPQAPPRLAGNVLIWQRGSITYRLEGPGLSREAAVLVAREIDGT